MVGLGNPGTRYAGTRHNVGFRVLDILADRLGLPYRRPFLKPLAKAVHELEGRKLVLIKPLTFMNRSGDILPGLLGRTGTPIERLLVVCDTLDLPPGQCRLKRKGSTAGHKGLISIVRRLGREDFMRLYVGIGRPAPTQDVVDYVLGEPAGEEAVQTEESLRTAADAILRLVHEEPERVMNVLNRKST